MRESFSMTLIAAAAVTLLAVAGCAPYNPLDPLSRPYMWYATGVNAHNIAAMAANPADLTTGRDSAKRQARFESDGVDRLWSGKQLPLLGGAAGASGASTGGAAPATGGGT